MGNDELSTTEALARLNCLSFLSPGLLVGVERRRLRVIVDSAIFFPSIFQCLDGLFCGPMDCCWRAPLHLMLPLERSVWMLCFDRVGSSTGCVVGWWVDCVRHG